MTLELDIYDCNGYITGTSCTVEQYDANTYTIQYDGCTWEIAADNELDAAVTWLATDFDNGYTIIDAAYTKRVWLQQ